MTEWMAFGMGSIVLLLISRKSLKSALSHGFYRFFAWEVVLGLVVLNFRIWFVDPFSWNQVISWILLCGSIPVLILGTGKLKKAGHPDPTRQDESLIAFEKTTRLVTTGIYRHIRHPLYCSILLLSWGVVFKNPSLLTILLGLAATLFLVMTAKADEKECVNYFGQEYSDYMSRTRMFIPFLF
jgi:protein-S-isoprenylcysteine O-methyltransferase Ste14